MKLRNCKLVKGLSVATLLLGSNLALAETVTVPATVTVNNAINFTFTGALDFGQVRALAISTAANCAGLVMSANPSVAFATAALGTQFALACTTIAGTIQSVGGTPARPTLTIAGVAPFTTLVVTLPPAAVNLTAATGPSTAQFKLLDFTAYKTSGTPAAVTTSIQTDATGGAVFTVGATLITDPADPTTATYQDLAYAGTFDVIVTY